MSSMMHPSYSCKGRSLSRASAGLSRCIKALLDVLNDWHWRLCTVAIDDDMTEPSSNTRTSILSLPPEVLGCIDRGLPLVDKLALRCASRQLYYYLPVIDISNQRKLTTCERIRAMSMLAFDRKQRLCALCKQWYPKSMFMDRKPSSSAKEDDSNKSVSRMTKTKWRQSGTAGAIDAPSGCCPWHSANLYKLVTQQELPIIVLPNWSQRSELLCLHCGHWKSEGDCKCPLTREGDNECGCGVREITGYRRYGGSLCQKLLFCRDSHGEVFVREWYRLPSSCALTEHALQKFERDPHDKNLYWRDRPIAG